MIRSVILDIDGTLLISNEAHARAFVDAANELVSGKQVTHVIVSHHHFDHIAGGQTVQRRRRHVYRP